MKEYSIYRDDIIIHQYVVDDTVSESLSGNKYVSFTITSKEELDIKIGDYIEYENKKYELFEPIDIEESNGVFTYPLTFYFQGYKLNNSIITDEGATTFAYHGEVSDFMALLINSLRVDYPEFTLGTIENASILDLSFDNSNCMAALQTVCENAEMEWDITGTVITVKRRIGEETDYVFEYGRNKGSYSVKLAKVANASVTTRMIGKGGTLNLPADYVSPDSPKRLNLGDEVLEKNVEKYGKITGVYVNENIYPRLINKTVLGVTVPLNIEEAGSWKIKLDIPFNLSEYYADNEVPIVKFQTGDLTGLDFEIVENSWNNTNKTLSIIVKEEEDGYYVPNKDRQPRIGDVFVLLNINMPQSYIDEATQELREATQNELSKKCEPQYAPSLSVQKHYIKKKGISLNIGDGITIKIGSRRVTTRIIGLNETSDDIRVELGDQMLYTYDTKVNNTIEQIQFTLKQLINIDDIKRLFYNLINAWYPKWFNQKLHKDAKVEFDSVKVADIVQSNNISSLDFTSGPLGSGHRIKDGNAEFQNLTVRGQFSVFEYLIQQVKTIGGKLLLSAASMKAGVVEELEDGYKCYFNTDGGTIMNPFIVGDQAFHQVYNGQTMSRYWRLITEVGSDYIVLSKTDCEAGSYVPQANDEILLLGNRTDINRMSAIILCAYDENSPYTAYYNGINSFSLEGKEVMREGNLNGIVDKDFGQLAGFGLFADNVFLKGQFWLMSGKTVEQSIVDGIKNGIDGIDVGTRNLITRRQTIVTDGADYPDETSYESELNDDGVRETTVTALTANNNGRAYRYVLIQDNLSEQVYNGKYIFSFDYKTNNEGGIIQIDWRNQDNTGLIVFEKILKNTNGTWERGWIECDFEKGSTQDRNLFVVLPANNTVGNYIAWRNIKLVRGTKGWDDSPAPEDTQNQMTALITEVKSEIKAESDKINLSVSEQISSTNQYVDNKTYKTFLIDTRELDPSLYYPVTMMINMGITTQIEVVHVMNGVGNPPWGTHELGFSLICRWSTNGSGWGTIKVSRTIEDYEYMWSSVIPVGDIGQMGHSNNEYIYVRGGTIYEFKIRPGAQAPVLHPNGVTVYDETLNITNGVLEPITFQKETRASIEILKDNINLSVEAPRWASGQVIFGDPTFKRGTNGVRSYNNPDSQTTRIDKLPDSPIADSLYNMKIVSSHESATGGGGFVQYCMSRANAIFIHRFIAKIPTGYSIAFTRYPIGEGGYQKWATDNKGTGGWKEYIYITYCGTSGDFGSFGYVYIEQSADVEWYLAYSDLFDITEGISGNLINQINISQEGIRIKANKIEISGATIFKDSKDNEVNIFGQGDDVFSINNGVFRVDKNGKLTCTNAEITGNITATRLDTKEGGFLGPFGFDNKAIYTTPGNKNGMMILEDNKLSFEHGEKYAIIRMDGEYIISASYGTRSVRICGKNSDALKVEGETILDGALTHRVRKVSSYTVLDNTDYIVICTSSSKIDILLPPNPLTGRVIQVTETNNVNCGIVSNNGKKIFRGGNLYNWAIIKNTASMLMFIYDGSKWLAHEFAGGSYSYGNN